MASTTDTTLFDKQNLSNGSQLEQNVSLCSVTMNLTCSLNFKTPKEASTAYNLYLSYKVWYLVINTVLILPTIFGNSLIIISLIRFKNLRKTKAFLLVGNLGISDLLIGLVFMPMDLIVLHNPILWTNQVVCVSYLSIIYTHLTSSVLNLFLLSLERFHAITRPLKHNTMVTTKRIYYVVCFTWIFVIPIGFIPLYLFISGNYYIKNFETCKDTLLFDNPYILVMNIIVIVALTASAVLFVAVIRIALRKISRKPLEGDPVRNNVRKHNFRRDIQHTRLMVFVLGTFIICWAPYCISSLIPSQSEELMTIRYLLGSLGYINCCLNWIVYGAINKRFRSAFIQILTCSSRSRSSTMP